MTDRPRLLRPTVAVGLAVLAVVLLVVLWATRPYGPLALPPPSGGHPVPNPTGTGPDATGSGDPAAASAAGATVSGTHTARPSASRASSLPAPAALTAAYATVGGAGPLGLTGYRGRLTISNPGPVTVTGWTVTVNLPSGATVTAANGAGFSQRGRTATFRPATGAESVPGHGSVEFTFDVASVLTDAPTDCAIDNHPCG